MGACCNSNNKKNKNSKNKQSKIIKLQNISTKIDSNDKKDKNISENKENLITEFNINKKDEKDNGIDIYDINKSNSESIIKNYNHSKKERKHNEEKNNENSSIKKQIDFVNLIEENNLENKDDNIENLNKGNNNDLDNNNNQIKKEIIIEEDNKTNISLLNNLKTINENEINLSNIFNFSSKSLKNKNNIFYFNEFYITQEYSTEKDFINLLKSSTVFKNKYMLSTRIINLNERQWNKENILISDLLKLNRENLEAPLFNKYLQKLITLHTHFNWIVWALSFYYQNSLLLNKPHLFNVKEAGLPSIESLEWVKGFEWKGLYIKVYVENYEGLKIKNEIKGLKLAFLDFIQIIDNYQINETNDEENNNKELLSNNIIFPLINYSKLNGILFTVSTCINKFIYDDNTNKNKEEEDKNFDLKSMNSIMKKNTKNVSFNFNNEDTISFNDYMINDDIKLENYSLKDLKLSKIFSKITNNNFIKIINNIYDSDSNKIENYKYILVNTYDLIPNLCDYNIDNNCLNIYKENENYFTKNKNYNDNINEIKNYLNIKKEDNINQENIQIFENNIYNLEYKFIFNKNNNKEIIDENKTKFFSKLPFIFNKELLEKLKEYIKNSNMNYILFDFSKIVDINIPKNNIMLYNFNKIIKLRYSMINNKNNLNINKIEYIKHLETFCLKINEGEFNNINNISKLKIILNKYGINKELLIFTLCKISNKFMNNLIIIYIFSDIIKKFIKYYFSSNYLLRLGIYERNKDPNILYFNNINKCEGNLIGNLKNKIYELINSILFLKSNEMENIYNSLSFFIFIEYLKWLKLGDIFSLDILNQFNDIYKPLNLLEKFITIARKNPFLFIDSLELKLNIRLNPLIKYQTSINLDNLKKLENNNDIIIFVLKINDYINYEDINSYILIKSIYKNSIKTNNIDDNDDKSIEKNSGLFETKSCCVKENNKINEKNLLNKTINNTIDIHFKDNSNGNLEFDIDTQIQNKNNNLLLFSLDKVMTLEWNNIIKKINFENIISSYLFKIIEIKDINNLNIYKYLNRTYFLQNFETLNEYQNNINQIFVNLITNDSKIENCLFISNILSFFNLYFIEKNIHKSKELLIFILENFKNQYLFNYNQLIILNIFESLFYEKKIKCESFYSINLIYYNLNFGEIRGKNNKGNLILLFILYKLILLIKDCDNLNANDYLLEMFNYYITKLNNDVKNKKENYFFNEKISFSNNFNLNENYQSNFFQKKKKPKNFLALI